MSLILRKTCQPTLDSVGLGEHHVTLDGNKYLTVSCDCGSPLFRVFGIRFDRTNPSKAEIEYAAELFKEYIKKHTSTIKKFLKAQTAFNNKPKLIMPESIELSYGNRYLYHLSTTDPEVILPFELVDGVAICNSNLNGVTYQNVSKVKFDQKKMDTAVKELVLFNTYSADSASFNNMQNLMDSCEL